MFERRAVFHQPNYYSDCHPIASSQGLVSFLCRTIDFFFLFCFLFFFLNLGCSQLSAHNSFGGGGRNWNRLIFPSAVSPIQTEDAEEKKSAAARSPHSMIPPKKTPKFLPKKQKTLSSFSPASLLLSSSRLLAICRFAPSQPRRLDSSTCLSAVGSADIEQGGRRSTYV